MTAPPAAPGRTSPPATTPVSGVQPSLRFLLAQQSNDYADIIADIGARLPGGWHDIAAASTAAGTRLSVVIATGQHATVLPAVLDALAAQTSHGGFEVILIDDASTDATATIAATHQVTDMVVRLPRPAAAGAARNLGMLLTHTSTVVHLDARMLLPEHVLADLAVRAHPDLILVGFRQLHTPSPQGSLPVGQPDLTGDPRVVWRHRQGTPLPHTGLVADEFVGHPLEATQQFRDLGHAGLYWDWDLPSMLDPCLAVLPATEPSPPAGSHPPRTWPRPPGLLTARLIADGCLLAPVPTARGFLLTDAGAGPHPGTVFDPAATAYHQRVLDQPHQPRPLNHSHGLARPLAEGNRLK